MRSKNIFTFLLMSFFLISCGSSKQEVSDSGRKHKYKTNQQISKTAKHIVDYAMDYKGTRYRYGGTSRRGLDCSGLVYISFLSEDISLPRSSRAMSLKGKRLKLREVSPGDLLFFKTDKNRRVINHVGLVVDASGSEIRFIHSTSSRGVIISELSQPYWDKTFVMARRVL